MCRIFCVILCYRLQWSPSVRNWHVSWSVRCRCSSSRVTSSSTEGYEHVMNFMDALPRRHHGNRQLALHSAGEWWLLPNQKVTWNQFVNSVGYAMTAVSTGANWVTKAANGSCCVHCISFYVYSIEIMRCCCCCLCLCCYRFAVVWLYRTVGLLLRHSAASPFETCLPCLSWCCQFYIHTEKKTVVCNLPSIT